MWLIRLGIRVSRSAPYHPQTNGKLERLHRSLKAEVLNGRSFADLDSVAREFQRWRAVYHHRRPHAALGMATPMQRCAASAKSYPSTLPSIGYAEHDTVVEVGWNGSPSPTACLLCPRTPVTKVPGPYRPAHKSYPPAGAEPGAV